ncbi:hypothetical protein PV703_15715 [Streptomyces sp. ME01-24h]|nr:hypothetical protein [Streptomyces sp. ME01-24h]
MDVGNRDFIEYLSDHYETARLRREHIKGTGLGGDMTIEALPTVYRGTTFRSALEASWAATLDSLGITWEYEPETITLPSGTRYIPDFHCPEIGTWIEVKGTGVPRVEKAHEFGETLACDCPRIRGILCCSCRWTGGELVLIGNPPASYNPPYDEYDLRPMWAQTIAARRHGGHISWTSTRKNTCWLTRCGSCSRATWFDGRRCRACRSPLVGAFAHRSGSDAFEFIRISGPALDDDAEDIA